MSAPGWPFSELWIISELRRRGLSVVNAGSLASAEIFDGHGQRWMHRALIAEARMEDAIACHELALRSARREIEQRLRASQP